MNYNDFQIFFKVVSNNSYLGAAKELGLPHSTVSRRVQCLERELNTQLLHRSTRKVSPTEEGLELYKRCSHLLSEFDDEARNIIDKKSDVTKTYNITMPTRAGLDYLGSWVTEFQANNKNVQFNIGLSSEYKNLIENQIDLAFRVGPLADSSDLAQFLWDIPYGVYAHKDFIKKYQIKKETLSIEEIQSLPAVVSCPTNIWKFNNKDKTISIKPNSVISFDDLQLTLNAAENKLGLCYLPESLVSLNKSKLIKLKLKNFKPLTRKMYAYYKNEKYISDTIKDLIQFIKDKSS